MIGAIGERELLALPLPLEAYPGVEQVLPIVKPYKLVSRELAADLTVIDVRGRKLGDLYFGFIAGPCTVEYREQTLETARIVAAAGATGCAAARLGLSDVAVHVPGLGRAGLEILAEAREETGLPLVTELPTPRRGGGRRHGRRDPDRRAEHAELHPPRRGRALPKPVLLKRGPSASIEELLMAAEYVVREGNERVILCERGIKIVRDGASLHARPGRGAGAEDGDAPAGDRRPVACSRSPRPRAAVGVRCDCGRGGRDHRRGASAPRGRPSATGRSRFPATSSPDFAREVVAMVDLMGKSVG